MFVEFFNYYRGILDPPLIDSYIIKIIIFLQYTMLVFLWIVDFVEKKSGKVKSIDLHIFLLQLDFIQIYSFLWKHCSYLIKIPVLFKSDYFTIFNFFQEGTVMLVSYILNETLSYLVQNIYFIV